MPDPWATNGDRQSDPSTAPYDVTPDDVDPLPTVPKALYIGTGGTVVLRGVGASADATFVNVADGQVLDVRAEYVRAAGTTASDIVALA